MIRHLVIRQLAEGVTPEQVAQMEENTRAFADIPGIRCVSTGPNLGLVPRSDGYDHLTMVDMDGPDTLPVFVAHPIHKVAADYSKDLTVRSIILDLDLDLE